MTSVDQGIHSSTHLQRVPDAAVTSNAMGHAGKVLFAGQCLLSLPRVREIDYLSPHFSAITIRASGRVLSACKMKPKIEKKVQVQYYSTTSGLETQQNMNLLVQSRSTRLDIFYTENSETQVDLGVSIASDESNARSARMFLLVQAIRGVGHTLRGLGGGIYNTNRFSVCTPAMAAGDVNLPGEHPGLYVSIGASDTPGRTVHGSRVLWRRCKLWGCHR